MGKAQVITIGTEITSGEVLNSNAAWVSLQLEELGLRVILALQRNRPKAGGFCALCAIRRPMNGWSSPAV